MFLYCKKCCAKFVAAFRHSISVTGICADKVIEIVIRNVDNNSFIIQKLIANPIPLFIQLNSIDIVSLPFVLKLVAIQFNLFLLSMVKIIAGIIGANVAAKTTPDATNKNGAAGIIGFS